MKAKLSSDSFAVACGSASVTEQLVRHRVDVEQVGSYGLAWLEPVLEFETESGKRTYRNVTPAAVDSILNSLGNGHTEHELFIPNIERHPYFAAQQRLVFDESGFKSPLTVPDLSILDHVLNTAPAEIIQAVETSGLRGRGGAGFPAHIKWRTVANTEADQRYIVCNADEGDSGTFSDRMIMEADPFKLIIGMIIAGYATGATEGYIYLRSEYPVALNFLTKAIEIAYREGLLGRNVRNSNFQFDVDIFVGAGAYICGEETSLLESLEGKRGEIRSKPPLPAIAGLLGKPTLVHNVISLASVPGIFQIGPEEYGALGVGRSTGTMPFQISGNIRQGGLIELPFGPTIRTLVEEFGQGTFSGRPLRTVQIGGPLGAYLTEDELDTPLTYEHLAEIGAGIGHGGLVVFDDSVDMREQAEYAFEFCEIESCGKCTPCRIGSVRGKETVKQLRDQNEGNRLQLIEDLCDVMEKASLCQMGGMTPIPVRSAIQKFPSDFASK